jgi:hypothetical protein
MPHTECFSPAGYFAVLQDHVSCLPQPIELPESTCLRGSYNLTTLYPSTLKQFGVDEHELTITRPDRHRFPTEVGL